MISFSRRWLLSRPLSERVRKVRIVKRFLVVIGIVVTALEVSFHAAAGTVYRFTVPEPQHHWIQVDATFSEVPSAPLELRMSRSSPGRYSLHEFAKNVYDVHAYGPDGAELAIDRSDESGWTVPTHGDVVTVKYKVYGDRVDGTYLAIDPTHIHMNMPAAIMWARGMDDRPAMLEFQPPAGTRWQAATQLHQGANQFEFSAPNLQYLMDSPIELGPLLVSQFNIGLKTFRFAAHVAGSTVDLAGFVKDVEKIVRQEEAIFEDYPEYEPGYYTFLADYLPYANSDGMEHRNSTVMTAPGTIAGARLDLLSTVAHEFFHSWNVERIRPRDLEPFDLDRLNMSDALWLAEGFTQYYGPLVLQRAGLVDIRETSRTLTGLVDLVSTGPHLRSAVEASRMAPFIDGGRSIDRTNWPISVMSYYPFGGAIALALDLSLRERPGGQTTLDDFMGVMWRRYGRSGGAREGYVDHPYSLMDVEDALAEVSDRTFARAFFARYIQGHDVPDFVRLLDAAGFTVRSVNPGRAWLGDIRLGGSGSGATIAGLVAKSWPIYAAGLDQDDEIQQLDGGRVGSSNDVNATLRRHRPGDRIPVTYIDRTGTTKTANITLAEDPHLEVVPVETAGANLTLPQRAFRDRWLGSRIAGQAK
jgi:predicted metalloprotease with PDZ domain